jgi:hypothetical protein
MPRKLFTFNQATGCAVTSVKHVTTQTIYVSVVVLHQAGWVGLDEIAVVIPQVISALRVVKVV